MMTTSLESVLTNRLTEALTPSYLEVVNESHGHGGYYSGKESHFKVVIVSKAFEGLRAVARHQKIYTLLTDIITPNKIHALALHTYTAHEWKGQAPNSPECQRSPRHSPLG